MLTNAIDSEGFKNIPEIEQRYILNLKKKFEVDKLVPEDFYVEYSSLCDKANSLWEKAKKENNYHLFKPYLADLIEKSRQLYTYKYPHLNVYDAMLNEYEIGMTSKEIDQLFEEVKESLIPIIRNLPEQNLKPYLRNFSENELMETAKYLLNYIGFNLNRGALDIYPHGCTEKINNNDIRIAFKKTNYPIDFLTTIIHEGGHGLFEQNMDECLYPYTTACIENLYGLHESQSRFYENILGRNINFWIPIYDDIKKLLHLDMNIDEFSQLLNNVSLNLIRTEADELTYCLHIIMRYEIERDIFNKNLSVDDLPNIWNQKMHDYLGITPQNDTEGILQDVHWSQGNFGYFPSYLLGNIYDGMFMEQVEKELGSIDDILRTGNVKQITNYLIEKIYKNGGAYTSKEVLEHMCHKDISSKPIIAYYTKKYTK